MTRLDLKSATVDQLVARFVEIAVAHGQALFGGDVSEANRLYDPLQAVVSALKSRDGDQRRALVPLFQHPDFHVRVKAAKATFALEPQAARAVLEAVAAAKVPVDSGEAGMCLWNLDRGVYKPS